MQEEGSVSSCGDRKNNPLGEGERSCDRKDNSSRGDRKSKFDGERHQKNPALTATSYAQQPIEDAAIQEMEHGVIDSVGMFPPIRRIHSRRYEQKGNAVNSRSLFRRGCSTVARRNGPRSFRGSGQRGAETPSQLNRGSPRKHGGIAPEAMVSRPCRRVRTRTA